VSEFIFTFGFGQTDPVTGASRSGMFARIEADDSERAREKMLNTYGRQWAFMYESEELAGVVEFGLTEVGISFLPPELEAILADVYTPQGMRIWWGAYNKLLTGRPVDVWRENPPDVLRVAEQLLGQVAT